MAWDYAKFYSHVVPGHKVNEAELRIDYPNAGRLTLFGGDHPHNMRGIYLDDCVLDEYAQMHPVLYGQVIRPALSDREGHALFAGTPFGRANQFKAMWDFADEEPGWYRQMLTWADTDILPLAEIERLKREQTPEEFAQEYECNWSAAIRGAFYGAVMDRIEAAGQVTTVPWDEVLPVHTSWDLGIRDTCVVCFWQVAGSELHCIECLAFESTGLPEIIRVLREKPYQYGHHIGPPDIRVRELGSGKSRLEIADSLGVRFDVTPNHEIADRIHVTRSALARCWFDKKATGLLVEALRQYRTEFDETKRSFRSTPLHDWTSHYADSAGYFMMMLDELSTWVRKTPKTGQQRQVYW